MSEILDRIKTELLAWRGVSMHEHRFGGIAFWVNGKEMGHLHGDRVADLPFPKSMQSKLISTGKASPHHFVPRSGWVSYYIEGIDGVQDAIKLFRLQYERMTKEQ